MSGNFQAKLNFHVWKLISKIWVHVLTEGTYWQIEHFESAIGMKAVSASKFCDYLVLWTRFLQLLPRKEEAMLTKVTGESGWPRGSVFPLQAASLDSLPGLSFLSHLRALNLKAKRQCRVSWPFRVWSNWWGLPCFWNKTFLQSPQSWELRLVGISYVPAKFYFFCLCTWGLLALFCSNENYALERFMWRGSF